jgi:ABC-type multidrug transport system fused ATPase/permease subunit
MWRFIKRIAKPGEFDKLEVVKSMIGAFMNALYFDIVPILSIPILIQALQNKDVLGIYKISIVASVLVFFSFFIRVQMRGWYWYSQRKFCALLEKYFRPKILMKDNLYFEKVGTGKVQSIVENGLNTWSRTFNDLLWYAVRISVTLVLGYYIISKVDKYLLIIFFVLFILSGWTMYFFRKKKYELDLIQKDIRNEFNALSVRTIMSRVEILHSDKIEQESKHLFDLKYKEYLLGVKTDRYGAYSIVAEIFFLILPFLGTVFYVYLYQPKFTAEEVALLISFIYFSGRMANMIWQVLSFVWNVMDSFPDIKKLWDFLDEIPEIKNYFSGKEFRHGGGEIVLSNVTFKYDEKNVLENFNLTIPPGQRLALVGQSGGGKTTIAKLISGYMFPVLGKVLVDGQDLGEISLKSFYKCLGYLTQEPSVFDGTIKENLLYSLDISKKKSDNTVIKNQMEQALLKAKCDFVFNFQKGLDTQIGEKGVRLSGGERQRLAIAKLFLKNPEIIILDEPTSALDSFSEEKITQALNELFEGRTVIIIAHRLQTVKSADRILVIEDGKIKEEGNHAELVEKGGLYSRMLAMQSGF